MIAPLYERYVFYNRPRRLSIHSVIYGATLYTGNMMDTFFTEYYGSFTVNAASITSSIS